MLKKLRHSTRTGWATSPMICEYNFSFFFYLEQARDDVTSRCATRDVCLNMLQSEGSFGSRWNLRPRL